MKDHQHQLQKAYFNALTGITSGGEVVPVYETVPTVAKYPYIKIGEIGAVDVSDKLSYAVDVTFLVDVVDRFPVGLGSRIAMQSIVNEVKLRVRTRTFLQVDDFDVITTKIENTSYDMETTKTYAYKSCSLFFGHILQQEPEVVEQIIQYGGEDVLYNGQQIKLGDKLIWQ